MKRAFKESKWYWYIPIISMFWIKQMAEWILNGENEAERSNRYVVIMYSFYPIQTFGIMLIVKLFMIL